MSTNYERKDDKLNALEALSPEEKAELLALAATEPDISLERSEGNRATLKYKPGDFSDAGNAEVLKTFAEGQLLFCDATGWLAWNGVRWEPGDYNATNVATDFTKLMLNEALGYFNAAVLSEEVQEQKTAKEYLRHAQNSRSAVSIERMLKLTKAALHIRLDELDADPFLLNTPAGIVNLKTGKIVPHDKSKLCTKITQVAPSDTGCEIWEKFISDVTCEDGSTAGFLQLVSGMAAIGKVYHEGVIIAYGGGRNGKSTLFNSLCRALGDYAGSLAVNTLTTERGGNKGASLATLRGKRLVVAAELEEGSRISTSMLKQIASTDRLVAEEKFRAPEEFEQSHTLVLYTNHLPRVGSTDAGTWRRLTAILFNARFEGSAVVANYADILFERAGGAILRWIIEGAVNFARNKFKLDIPESVQEVSEGYRASEDWIGNYINERCTNEVSARTGARDLYIDYRAWAEENGDYVRRERDFAAALEGRGYQKIAPGNRRVWIGLKLNYSDNGYYQQKYGT